MPEQLDIFADSLPVVLRNAVLDALSRRDAPAARAAHDALVANGPGDAHRSSLARLVDALESPSAAPITDPAAFAMARQELAGPLATAAGEAFGAAGGTAWMRPLWQALAARCAALAFDPAHPEVHAAPLWLAANDWALAAETAGRIESWRRIPAPLAWRAEACHRRDGLEAAWPLLAELAWLAPRRLAGLLQRLDDPVLGRLQRRFEAAFDGAGDATDLAWFPAWLLTSTPALAPHLGRALPSNQTPPEQAMRVLLDALVLEREGRHRELVERRRTLAALNASLCAIYLSTR